MNDTTQVSEVGMMRLTLREDSGTDFLGRAAEEIGQLPGVLRVRANPLRQEIEIVFKQPAEGLLRQVNNTLQVVGNGDGRVEDAVREFVWSHPWGVVKG